LIDNTDGLMFQVRLVRRELQDIQVLRVVPGTRDFLVFSERLELKVR